MKKRLEELILLAINHKASDIHFLFNESINISIRINKELLPLKSQPCDAKLLNYLAYLSNMDMSQYAKPQSGAFSLTINNNRYDFRFALLNSNQKISGVLRIMNYHSGINLNRLFLKGEQRAIIKDIINHENGLILISGPTGSGKTTTLYSLLNYLKKKTIYTLEDPIEVYNPNFVQIQINNAIGLTYKEGIKQILRHDPDIIMIGEIRDEETAKMAIRSALTGHLVFASIHASDCKGTILRLMELGISQFDLREVLLMIANQRLYQAYSHTERISLYEIYRQKDIDDFIDKKTRIYPSLYQEVDYAIKQGWIEQKEKGKTGI